MYKHALYQNTKNWDNWPGHEEKDNLCWILHQQDNIFWSTIVSEETKVKKVVWLSEKFYYKTYFLKFRVWTHLFTLEHTTFLYWPPSSIPLKNENCNVLMGFTAWLRWSQCPVTCYIWLAEKGKSTRCSKLSTQKKQIFQKMSSVEIYFKDMKLLYTSKNEATKLILVSFAAILLLGHMQIALLFFSKILIILNMFLHILRFETRLISNLTFQWQTVFLRRGVDFKHNYQTVQTWGWNEIFCKKQLIHWCPT
jgi:hypothetical protein